MIGLGLAIPLLARRAAAGAGVPSDSYAENEFSPDLVVDFVNDYFRVGGSASTFSSMFTFTRTTSATYVDSNGDLQTATSGNARIGHHIYENGGWVNEGLLKEEAATNLFTYSEDFSQTDWVKSGGASTSVSAAPASPWGDAWYLEANADGNMGIWQEPASSTLDHATSILAKPGSLNWLLIRVQTSTGFASRFFNVSTGELGGVYSTDDEGQAHVQYAGDGFYRCWMVAEIGGAAKDAVFYGATDENTMAVTSGDNIIISCAQCETGRRATSYIPTTSSTATRNEDVLTIAAADLPFASTMSIAFNGEITYNSTAGNVPVKMVDWTADADNNISLYVDTTAGTGTIYAEQEYTTTRYRVSSDLDFLTVTDRQPISIASRHTAGEINFAVDGQEMTKNTGVTGMPALGSTDLTLAETYNGTVSQFRMWDQDIGLAGIKSATAIERHVFLIVGQSNAIGRATALSGDRHVVRVRQWDQAGDWLRAAQPLDHNDPVSGDVGWSLWFQKAYSDANPGVEVLFVPCAEGSTGFYSNDWNDGDLLYNAAVSRANAAIAGVNDAQLKGILCLFGENEASNSVTEVQMATYLDNFITAIRGDVTGAATVPMVFGQIGTFTSYPTTSDVNAAIADTPNRNSNTGYVSSTGLTSVGDNIHYDRDSLRTMGAGYYTSFAAI